MTESEKIKIQVFAYKKLKNNNQAFFVDNHEDAERIINALEKQIPNEPIIDSYCLFTSYTCPVCRHEVELSDYYCRCCGQKIRKTTNNWIGVMKNEID